MHADPERVSRICRGLAEVKCDAVVCAMPANVLLLSGYCPVVGTAIAVARADGRVAVLVPEDELELAAAGRADQIDPFTIGSLDKVQSASQAICDPLTKMLKSLHLDRATIAHDGGEMTQPAPYVAIHLYGSRLVGLLSQAIPDARLTAGDELLEKLRTTKTEVEINAVQLACDVAGDAFRLAAGCLRSGQTEAEAAAQFRSSLLASHPELQDAGRLDGFMFCSSGPNSYEAYAAYQRSRGRRIRASEPVLVHCNSHVNGWWTDITRTYCIGEPTHLQAQIYKALLKARAAALSVIRPGTQAAVVDRAAREVLEAHGFGDAFKHPAGHGVGFAAINHNARPRLHPRSPDVLEQGMVFNVEPGVYIRGFGGMRHCDVVTVTTGGVQVLTPFQASIGELRVAPSA